jgi:hypothetical protein
MHAELARAAGDTLAGTNFDSFWQYAEMFPGPNARRIDAALRAAWIGSVIEKDHAGLYYPFSLSYTGLIAPAEGMKRFFRASVNASMETFGDLSRSDSKRHHSDKSFGVIVLRCISASGLVHWHGFIRMPLLAINGVLDDAVIAIEDHNERLTITGPSALRTMNLTLRDQFHPRPGVSMSLGIGNQAHDGERHPRAADHRRYPHVTSGWLTYLQGTADGEVRDWRDLEFLPHAVFKRVLA